MLDVARADSGAAVLSRKPRRRVVALVALTATLAWHYAYIYWTTAQERDATAWSRSAEAAAQWRDDVWPFREQAPWDISRDFAHPRAISYEVRGVAD